jgi:NACHT domain
MKQGDLDNLSQKQNNQVEGNNIKGDLNFSPKQYFQTFNQVFSLREKKLLCMEQRQRNNLLGQVENYWVKGILEKVLPGKPIELVLQKRSLSVVRPVRGFDDESEQATTDAKELFNDTTGARTLLILGELGAGKTIMLLQLAQNLIARAREDENQEIPVVFNLSSWRSKRNHKTIADWLIEELHRIYKVSPEIGETLIKEQQLILLLDGLDEVEEIDRRKDCIEAINKFTQDHGETEIVVCSHTQEYESLFKELKLRDAIEILPLNPQQINQYLDTEGEQLKTLITKDSVLNKLAQSPLMLSVMTKAYNDKELKVVPQRLSPEDRAKHLFDAYIKWMFSEEKAKNPTDYEPPYKNQQTREWLTWLAQQMFQASQPLFLIEQMQPKWLNNKAQKQLYRLGSGLVGGLIFGLIFGFLALLSASWTCPDCTEDNVSWGITNGLIAFLFFGVALGWRQTEIETVETIQWSWQKAKNSIIRGAVIGFLAWILLSFALLFWYQKSDYFAEGNGYIRSFGLIGGLIAGLSYVLVNALKGPTIERKSNPNQGIWVSLKSAIIIVLMISIPLLVLIWWRSDMPNTGLRVGLRWALLFGFGFGGGVPCIKHLVLRLILHRNNDIPWNYASFLNYATQRGFLQRVGGGYIFFHPMLQKHFARME